jgi:Lecithin retinol acyltransferase
LIANTSARILSASDGHSHRQKISVTRQGLINKGFAAHGPDDAKDLATVLEIKTRPAMNSTSLQTNSESIEGSAPRAESRAATSTIDLPIGAHLVTQRRGYEHHGIYVGNGRVVHYAGFAGSTHRGPVEEIELARFAAGHPLSIRTAASARYVGDEAVRRARSRLGENRYRLLTNNCEHFCAWCLFGESHSEQVHGCLRHPRAGVHALVCLVKAFVESGAKGAEVATQMM